MKELCIVLALIGAALGQYGSISIGQRDPIPLPLPVNPPQPVNLPRSGSYSPQAVRPNVVRNFDPKPRMILKTQRDPVSFPLRYGSSYAPHVNQINILKDLPQPVPLPRPDPVPFRPQPNYNRYGNQNQNNPIDVPRPVQPQLLLPQPNHRYGGNQNDPLPLPQPLPFPQPNYNHQYGKLPLNDIPAVEVPLPSPTFVPVQPAFIPQPVSAYSGSYSHKYKAQNQYVSKYTKKQKDVPVSYAPKIPVTEIDCKKLEDGLYGDPTNSCSNKYFSCSNGIGDRFYCPETLSFDVISLVCEVQEYVPACSGKSRPQAEPQRPTIPLVTEAPAVDCKGQPDGPAPYNTCSQTYYVCSGGVTKTMYCHDDLYYASVTDTCESYLVACEGRPKKVYDQPIIRPRPPVPVDCENLPNGLYPDPNNQCSTKYYQCSHGEGYEMPCPEGSFYDAENYVCDHFDNIPVCSGLPRPVPEPQRPSDFVPKQSYEFDCSDLDDGHYPAGDCENYYWSCSAGQTDKRSCPDKLKWDPEYEECGSKAEIPSCGGYRTTPNPIRDFPQPQPKPVDFDCVQKNDGRYVNPRDPCGEIYYSCSGGKAYEQKCYENLAYDPQEDACQAPAKIPSCHKNVQLPADVPVTDRYGNYHNNYGYSAGQNEPIPLPRETFRPIETRRTLLPTILRDPVPQPQILPQTNYHSYGSQLILPQPPLVRDAPVLPMPQVPHPPAFHLQPTSLNLPRQQSHPVFDQPNLVSQPFHQGSQVQVPVNPGFEIAYGK